ncbi:esterase [Aspergillus luchuensis]|uniref:Esterase n=1 Tax=Aspergillus kawachii TaxID=1069201 RepID=A0A146FZT9_ASPKA|nr:esterase [Aspergillus luchuensis]
MELLAIAGLLWAISKASSWTALKAPVRGSRGGATATKHIVAMAVRTFFETVTIDQFRYAYSPDTSARLLEAWARRAHTALKTVKLSDGTTAFWLGNPDAERLLLHLPGGAYCLPALPSHIDYSTSILKHLGQAGINAGMLFLPYDLTPTAQYPHQMKQAVALLQYVIEDLGKRPSDIVLLGDSAGAHLILSVLSHLAHPHPHIPPLLLREELAGALLLSPWMGESRTDYDSCRRNASRDLVSPGLLTYWADMFLGDAEFDSYNRPAGAPEGWWRDLPVEEIFIGVGGYEVLYDSIMKTARKIEVSKSKNFPCDIY